MKLYKYRAVSENGQVLEGIYEANNKKDVLSMLRSNNYYLIFVEESVEKERNINLFCKLKEKDISIFCRQFYSMLNAGLNIIECLDIMKEQTSNRKLKKILGIVYRDVQKGYSFSEALKKFDKIFPKFLINMIEVGEVSGNLELVMQKMAIHYEKENKIKNKVKGALIYPILLITVAISVVMILFTCVMPTFIKMFESNNILLPSSTRALLSISNWFKDYWYILATVVGLFILKINTTKKSKNGKLLLDSIKLKIPIIGKLITKIITSRFARILSALLKSGIPLVQSLEIICQVLDNDAVVKELSNAKKDINKGETLSKTIKNIDIFPTMLSSMIGVGEESGDLDKILDKTADFYDEEIETVLKKLTTIIEPILIIIISLVVGFIVVSIATPILDIINTIQI